MNKKVAFVSVVAVVIAGGYFVGKIINNQSTTTPIPISQSDWKKYENTAYLYNIKYPQKWSLGQVQEEERGTIEESRAIEIFLPGGKGVVGVTAWDPSVFNGTDQASVEFRKTISVDLKSFAEAARTREIDDKNPNFPNKKVRELKEVVFASQKAFSYVVMGSMDGYGSDSDNYLFVENKGVKYMIYYSLNTSLPQEIANTFEFTAGSATTSVQADLN